MLLPEPEPVRTPGREVADLQLRPGEGRDLSRLPLREEALGDPALIENLDGARMESARAPAVKILTGAPFDDGDVDVRQGQLTRQHQAGGTRAHNDDICVHKSRVYGTPGGLRQAPLRAV